MRTALRLAAPCVAALAAVPAAAALAPNYQRLAELNAVLDHPGVAAAFGGTPIDGIEYVRTDLYRVTAAGAEGVRLVRSARGGGKVRQRRRRGSPPAGHGRAGA